MCQLRIQQAVCCFCRQQFFFALRAYVIQLRFGCVKALGKRERHIQHAARLHRAAIQQQRNIKCRKVNIFIAESARHRSICRVARIHRLHLEMRAGRHCVQPCRNTDPCCTVHLVEHGSGLFRSERALHGEFIKSHPAEFGIFVRVEAALKLGLQVFHTHRSTSLQYKVVGVHTRGDGFIAASVRLRHGAELRPALAVQRRGICHLIRRADARGYPGKIVYSQSLHLSDSVKGDLQRKRLRSHGLQDADIITVQRILVRPASCLKDAVVQQYRSHILKVCKAFTVQDISAFQRYGTHRCDALARSQRRRAVYREFVHAQPCIGRSRVFGGVQAVAELRADITGLFGGIQLEHILDRLEAVGRSRAYLRLRIGYSTQLFPCLAVL